MIFLGILFFVLGAVIGSFLNVVVLRYNTGMTVVGGRSECFSCSKTLRWYELVPVVSFCMLRGKCSSCKSGISWQYPLVELFTASLFLFYFLNYSFEFSIPYILNSIFHLLILSILIAISVYDLRHKIIPDGLVYAFITLSFIGLFLDLPTTAFHAPSISELIAGPILFAFFFILWFVSKGTWMGFGDVKLVLGFGWFLGLAEGISAVVLAFWIGAAVSLVIMAFEKFTHKGTLSLKSQIPFAPFLILGLFIEFFAHFDIFGLKLLLGM
ncbi:MAG TPA: prepilin peptidase [Candidatus Paceibacterota bacterium]